jgi:hypothetical protein
MWPEQDKSSEIASLIVGFLIALFLKQTAPRKVGAV